MTNFSAARSTSGPDVANVIDQSTHFAKPSLSNSSAMFPLGCMMEPTKF